MQQTACSDIRPGGGQRRPPAVDDSAAAQQPAPVVYGVHVHVERPPVQQAVRPVEPGVVQHVQRHHREQHVPDLPGAARPPRVQLGLAPPEEVLHQGPHARLDQQRACTEWRRRCGISGEDADDDGGLRRELQQHAAAVLLSKTPALCIAECTVRPPHTHPGCRRPQR